LLDNGDCERHKLRVWPALALDRRTDERVEEVV